MKENKPILKLTRDAVTYNLITFIVLLVFFKPSPFEPFEFNHIRISTREFNTWLAIFSIPFIVSFVFAALALKKDYVNSTSRKIPITVNVCNTAVIILLALWLLSLSSILPTAFSNIYMYIAVSLFLLCLTVQIYYYSKMKIAYFFIILAGAFLIEFFLISYYTLHTVTGAMGTLILIAALLIASDVVIYKNA